MYRSVILEKESDRASDLLIAARGHIPKRLINDASYDNLIKTASSVPLNFALSPFLFECFLDDSSRTADLSFGLFLDCDRPDFNLFGFEQEHSVLQKTISSLLGKGENRLKSKLSMIWLEYDVGKNAMPIPGLFLTPKIGIPARSAQIVAQIRRDLKGQYMNARYSKKIGDIFRQLPHKSFVRQIGIMASRGASAPLRLCLAGLDHEGRHKIEKFLDCVGYDHAYCDFFSLYKKVEPFIDICDLAIDITERIEPSIGLELMIRQRNPQREAAWHHVLRELRGAGLCSQDKIDELLNFYGYDSIIGNEQRWPRTLADYWKEHQDECCSFLIRSVNHLKICFDPAEGMSAKAYLKIAHHWKNLNGNI